MKSKSMKYEEALKRNARPSLLALTCASVAKKFSENQLSHAKMRVGIRKTDDRFDTVILEELAKTNRSLLKSKAAKTTPSNA